MQARADKFDLKERQLFRIKSQKFNLISRPLIMGILNVTPDSFSDGGLYVEPQKAIQRAQEMVLQGADIIDVGAESTRPGSSAITPKDEIARLKPLLIKLKKYINIPLSIATSKYDVMSFAVDHGVEVINDVGASWQDDRIPKFLSDNKLSVILMHKRGKPISMQQNLHYEDIIKEVKGYLKHSLDRVLDAGLADNRVALDPGIGFGKSAIDCFRLICELDKFIVGGQPVLVGLSRKSFINKIFGTEHTAIASAMNLMALQNGASILRVHDIIEASAIRDLYIKSKAYGHIT